MIKKILEKVCVFIICFVVLQTGILFSLEKNASDMLFQRAGVSDKRICIIAIDDKSLQKYGAFDQWSRTLYADLLHILNEDESVMPAVIAFDVLFLDKKDEAGDMELVKACKDYDNVIGAVNLQFKPTPELSENGKYILNQYAVSEVDYPYEQLNDEVELGYANCIVDADGYVRRSKYHTETSDGTINSLSSAIYEKYMSVCQDEVTYPELDSDDIFSFSYAGRQGSYSVISFADVCEGKVPASVFKDQIVLVGAYAAGLFDSYMPAISHGDAMYGVEIQANIVDALLNGNTQMELGGIIYNIIASVIIVLFSFAVDKLSPKKSLIFTILSVAAYLVFAFILYKTGFILPVFVFITAVIILYIKRVAAAYLEEYRKRKQIHKAFKQYVAPQVVDKISKKGEFEVKLGGEKRNIAVMFVDIRGFTTMSEKLMPEQVVEILNSYLNLATESIFSQEGTLDKFVGDAAMAVFNAPFDLDDYVFRAVSAAIRMREGAKKLSDEIKERFGNEISFGIGVNVGDAVVGNIGCDFRMDYTAIGDTVNTAARLESNAKGNQILISEAVYEQLQDRIEVLPVGEIPLKGKKNGVMVYQVVGLLNN